MRYITLQDFDKRNTYPYQAIFHWHWRGNKSVRVKAKLFDQMLDDLEDEECGYPLHVKIIGGDIVTVENRDELEDTLTEIYRRRGKGLLPWNA